MSVQKLVDSINSSIKSTLDVSELVHKVRALISSAIVDRNFLQECVERILANVSRFATTGRYEQLFIDDQNSWRMAIFLWNPNSENQPHQHNTWSVSGVINNRLQVRLFDSIDGRLLERSSMLAGEGQAGYLIPPCIHALGNPSSDQFTITLHVFCDSKTAKQRDDDTIWLGEDDSRANQNYEARATRDLLSCLLLVDKLHSAIRFQLLENIFNLGGIKIKLAAYKRLIRSDLTKAQSFGTQLEQVLTGQDQIRLQKSNRRLYGTTHE